MGECLVSSHICFVIDQSLNPSLNLEDTEEEKIHRDTPKRSIDLIQSIRVPEMYKSDFNHKVCHCFICPVTVKGSKNIVLEDMLYVNMNSIKILSTLSVLE